MYALIWRILPGPTWLKVIEALVLVALIVCALFAWVYPWVDDQIETDPVINQGSATSVSAPLDSVTLESAHPQGQ